MVVPVQWSNCGDDFDGDGSKEDNAIDIDHDDNDDDNSVTIMHLSSMGDELKWQISDDYRFATCLDHKMVDNLGQINKYGAFLLILLMVCSIFNIC